MLGGLAEDSTGCVCGCLSFRHTQDAMPFVDFVACSLDNWPNIVTNQLEFVPHLQRKCFTTCQALLCWSAGTI